MIARCARALAVAVLACAAPVVMSGAAHASHAPESLCVSRFEWRKLRAAVAAPGLATLDSVSTYLDGPGTDRGSDGIHYAVCGKRWYRARVVVFVEGDVIVGVFRLVFAPGFTARPARILATT